MRAAVSRCLCGAGIMFAVCLLTPPSGAASSTAGLPPRTIELVSEPAQAGSLDGGVISEDGNRVVYQVLGGTPDSTYGQYAQLSAVRTDSGWRTKSALPPREMFGTEDAAIYAASDDLTRFVVLAKRHLGASGPLTFYQWEPSVGLTRGTTMPEGNSRDRIALVSGDVRHVLFPMSLDPTSQPTRLFDVSRPEPIEVGLMPDGSSPQCGIRREDAPIYQSANLSQNWITDDGSRVVFQSRGSGDCGTKRVNVYLREGGGRGATTLISGPALDGIDRGGRFVQATDDLRTIFFTSASRIVDSDRNDGTDLYRYTSVAGNVCITCVVSDANVNSPPAGEDSSNVLVGEDGERAYFTTSSALTPMAPDDGQPKLYVWRASAPNEISYVSPADQFFTAGAQINVAATRDASVVIFSAKRAELDPLTNSTSGGFSQYYRWDDRTGSLSCISCVERPTGSVEQFVGRPGLLGIEKRPSVLTEDGEVFFFTSTEAMVPADVNRTADVYEWNRGVRRLVTNGRAANEQLSLLSASANGESVLFQADGAQVTGVEGAPIQLYVSRVNGRSWNDQAAPSCAGDGCQGPLPPPPTVPVGSSGARNEQVPDRDAGDAPKPRLKLGRRTSRGARVTIRVRVTASGRITVGGPRLGSVTKTVAGPGIHRFQRRLTRRARKELMQRGRLVVRLRVTYEPKVGPVAVERFAIRMRAQ